MLHVVGRWMAGGSSSALNTQQHMRRARVCPRLDRRSLGPNILQKEDLKKIKQLKENPWSNSCLGSDFNGPCHSGECCCHYVCDLIDPAREEGEVLPLRSR